MLGVDQAGGAGGGDDAPGGVGERAAGGGGAGDDGEDPAGAQHPLAGGEQPARRPAVLAAGSRQPGPQQPATASAACPAAGSPGGEHRAGPPGRSRATGYGTGAGTRCAVGDEAEDAPPGGCRGLGDRRRAAAGGGDQVAGNGERVDDPAGGCGGDRPAARRAVRDLVGGQAGPDAQRHAGACPAGRAAPGRRGVRGRAGRLAVPGWVEGLCHGGWSRVPPLSALTLHKSGFRGLFSPARRRNIRAARITRENLAGKIFPGFPGAAAALYHMPCTWRVPGVPAIYLAGAAQVSALMYLAAAAGGPAAGTGRAGRAGGGTGAGTSPGTRQVHAGRRRPGARYIAGTRQVDRGWLDGASFPSRLAHLELPHGQPLRRPGALRRRRRRVPAAVRRPAAPGAARLQGRGRPAGPAGAAG